MIVTEIYKGQGLGNQLFCYVTTRAIATDHGYSFGIQSPNNLKSLHFMRLDLGKPVIGGSGPEGGPPRTLPKGIRYYYNERKISHPTEGFDIRTYDKNLVSIPDSTKIDGSMQDEQYFIHYKKQIRSWLAVREEFECFDYASDNICVINFRGGEYIYYDDLYLKKSYWENAIAQMRKINSEFQFVVITDDVRAAKKIFPHFEVKHFDIAKDYVVIKNAHYLILSNSSFAWFPAWLNTNLKKCIAPKYWARHNTSNDFWCCSYNLTSGWDYLDRNGNVFDYKTCKKELQQTIKNNKALFTQKKIINNFLVVSNYYNDLSWVAEYTDNYIIYDQSDADIHPPHLSSEKVIKSPHLGHNIRDYCTFIIDNYDNLPETVIFATGNIFPRHVSREYFNSVCNNAFFTPIEDMSRHSEHWPMSFFSSDGGFCELNNSWYLELDGFHPTKYFHTYDDFLRYCFKNPIIPRYIRFAPGANYIVPKEHILKYPKIFYENLRLFVSHSKKAIPGESHIIERALYTIWMSSFEISPHMLKPVTKSFKAVSRTKRSVARVLFNKVGKMFSSSYRYLHDSKRKIEFIKRKIQ